MSSPPGTIGRRSFLRGAGAAALAFAGGGAAAACTSAVHELDAAGDDATPVRGGTLKVGTPWDIVPANILTNTATTPALIGLVYESLIRYPNDRLEPRPLLAKSWSLAPDGLSIALELRDDVTFHTGRPFTSADVEFTLRTYADPKWSAQLKSTAAAITEYDTSAPHRIVLKFAHPLGNIFDLLDTAPMLDRETIGRLATGDAFVGTGPFRFVDRIPNSRLVFERNEHYWVPERPYLDRVQLSIIPDSQAQLNALRSGQVGLAHGLNPRDIENLAARPGFKSITYDGAELQMYVGVNVRHPALADVRLRQAIAYALDRDRIIGEVFRGAGYPLNVPWPRNSPAYDAARNTKYARDLGRARELVAQVGRPPQIPLSYNTSTPSHGATAQIVQANLADAGIEVTLDPNDDGTAVKKLIGGQYPGLWVTDHSWAQFVPSTLTVSAYPFNARKNASHYESAAYVAAADAAWRRSGGTDTAAVAAYRAVSDQLLEGLFLIEIGVRFNQAAASKRLHGVSWTKRRETVLTEAFLS
ncbi:ABC transporter substrate-binding protein [Nocardia wallacei]|uniref:ABC transporter substrate-binding protein n=1 Tax=Nocardia wallacei TaxID=480035 RepID=UPI0024581716|nr:ABC transporter substrate-binding protein [Nocardia wallacei]